jgi:hypothetical protein
MGAASSAPTEPGRSKQRPYNDFSAFSLALLTPTA